MLRLNSEIGGWPHLAWTLRPWELGYAGKGLVTPTGNVVHWRLDRAGRPDHNDVEARMGGQDNPGAFSIDHMGGVQVYGFEQNKLEDQVLNAHPAFHLRYSEEAAMNPRYYDDDNDFHESHLAWTIQPWEPGHSGKGILTPRGAVIHWRTQGDRPDHHEVVNRMGGEEQPAYFYIDPHGGVNITSDSYRYMDPSPAVNDKIMHAHPAFNEFYDPYGEYSEPAEPVSDEELGQLYHEASASYINAAKFTTSLSQHHRRKRNYHRRFGWPLQAAVDPQWLENEWYPTMGQYMYHGTSPEAAHEIVTDGLYPHDELGTGESHIVCPNCNYNADPEYAASVGENPGETCPSCGDDYLEERPAYSNSSYAGKFWEPRSGHVYLGTDRYSRSYVKNGSLLRVDMRKLNPSMMNADEDHFAVNPRATGVHPIVQKVWDDQSPPFPGSFNEGSESLGQWADDMRLGQDPEETHYSMGMGSMAYNGHIPPEAIEEVDPNTGQPHTAAWGLTPEELPPNQEWWDATHSARMSHLAMTHYRYLMENYPDPSQVSPTEFDWAEQHDPDLARGVQAWKQSLWPNENAQ